MGSFMNNEIKIVAENLVYYRKAAGYTQLEIAEKLNYSDKSISKWERGEGAPDIFVLKTLATFYGVTMDDFFHTEKKKVGRSQKKRHWYITSLSVALVWIVIAIAFAVLMIAIPKVYPWWILFLHALIGTFVITTVFSSIWRRLEYQLISISGIIWSVCLATYFSVHMVLPMEYDWLIIITGVPMEILEVLWFLSRRSARKRIREEREKEKDVD